MVPSFLDFTDFSLPGPKLLHALLTKLEDKIPFVRRQNPIPGCLGSDEFIWSDGLTNQI